MALIKGRYYALPRFADNSSQSYNLSHIHLSYPPPRLSFSTAKRPFRRPPNIRRGGPHINLTLRILILSFSQVRPGHPLHASVTHPDTDTHSCALHNVLSMHSPLDTPPSTEGSLSSPQKRLFSNLETDLDTSHPLLAPLSPFCHAPLTQQLLAR